MPSRSLVKKTAQMRRERLRIERLEDRCVMDGAGFVSDLATIDTAVEIDWIDRPFMVGQPYLIDVPWNGLIDFDPPISGIVVDPVRWTPLVQSNDRFTVYQGSAEQRFDVLQNDGIVDPQIVSVSETILNGSVRIADGWDAVWYQPAPNATGSDVFKYTVRGANGVEQSFQVTVTLAKPYQWVQSGDAAYIEAGSGPVVLDPLANDNRLDPGLSESRIESVLLPEHAGRVTLVDDGRRMVYEPADGFNGGFSLRYVIRYGDGEHQTIDASFQVEVAPQFLAVENWFEVEAGATDPTRLDVLASDPLLQPFRNRPDSHYRDTQQEASIAIKSVSPGSRGGTIVVSQDGASVSYTPAEGFVGNETFTYEVESSGGVRQSARVTVRVSDGPGAEAGFFSSVGEFRQMLIDRAVARYAQQFGKYDTAHVGNWELLERVVAYDSNAIGDTAVYFQALSTTNSMAEGYSITNVQVAGVDEADIVETDGRYVYTFSDGRLAIIDLIDPADPKLVSLSQLRGGYQQMYLQGDRLTLLRTGGASQRAEVVVLDISDRAQPSLVERTELGGYIADSRAIGDRVYLVVKRELNLASLHLPPLEKVQVVAPESSTGAGGIFRNETLHEYLDRIRDLITDTALPDYRAYGPDGELAASGLLAKVRDIQKALLGDVSLISVLTLDAGDDSPGPIAPATSFVADRATDVYVSADALYIFAFNESTNTSKVTKLALQSNGATPVVATGVVAGRLLNQFAADEHDGTLRVVTTGEFQRVGTTWNGFRYALPPVPATNLFVLKQDGSKLDTIGKIEQFAEFDFLKSVRFAGTRAYAVTFRAVDPLFSIDLSDPTNPTLRGELVIPGFSDYLHPVGENYLLAIGRYAIGAAENNGGAAPLQITLFNVADLDNPIVAAQLTYDRGLKSATEAWIDHHAVAYFAETGVLAIPVTWTGDEAIDEESMAVFMGAGIAQSWEGGQGDAEVRKRSAVWTFQVTTDQPGWPTIQQTGSIEHGVGASAARRALRLGESLVTVSNHYIKVNDLNDPERQIGKAYIGPILSHDNFTIEEDSGANTLDVLGNDRPGAGGEVRSIAAVSQPTQGGLVTIAEDGRSLVFTPDDDFFGDVCFTYTVIDPARGEETAEVQVSVANTPDTPTAVDDEASVWAGSSGTTLNLLGNDVNPDAGAFDSISGASHVIFAVPGGGWRCGSWLPMVNGLRITEIGPTDQGGTVQLDHNGRVTYTPAVGFEGVESFTYTVMNQVGLTSTATVVVTVDPKPEEVFRAATLLPAEPVSAGPVAEPLARADALALPIGPIAAVGQIAPRARAAVFATTPMPATGLSHVVDTLGLPAIRRSGQADAIATRVGQVSSEAENAIDAAFATLASDLDEVAYE